MKFLKVLKILLALVAVLVVTVLLVFLFWLGPTAKVVAERIGTKALGTPLMIEHLSINPRKGTLLLTGFTVGNPDQFAKTNAVSLASLNISLDVGSLFSSTIVVHRVQIESPHFVYEQSSASDNVSEFIENIKEFVGPKDKATIELDEDETPDKTSKVVVVEMLEINDIRFFLSNDEDTQLNIDLNLKQLTCSMTNGYVRLHNLNVSNPGRLETPNLFELESISVDLDPATFHGKTLSILDTQIRKPHAYLERNAETDTVAEFMKIAESITSRIETKKTAPAEELPATTKTVATKMPTRPPVELHNLVIDDMQLKLLDSTRTNAPAGPAMLLGISSIQLKLQEGRLQVTDITVPSPAGFSTTNLFHLAGIGISIDPASLFTKQTVIENILIDSPAIHLEQTQSSGNFTTLQETLMGFVPPAPENAEGAPTPEAAPPVEAPEPIPLSEQPVIVQNLSVTNFAINLRMPAPEASLGEKLNPLDKISLRDRSKGSGTNAVPTDPSISLNVIAFQKLSVTPLEGKVQISGLKVANVHGFANPYLTTIKLFEIDLDPSTLQSDVLIINEILIDDPDISYERQLSTDNIKALQETIGQALSKRHGYVPEEVEKKEAETAESQKVVINHLLIRSGKVKAKISALPTAPIPLPKIEMADIGKEEGGASYSQAFSKVWTALYDAIVGSVASTTGFAADALKGAGNLTLGALETVTGIGGGKKKVEEEKVMEQTEEPEATGKEDPEQRQPSVHRRRPGRMF